MRSTGNKGRQKEKLLSIRLSPDGLSFWTTGLEKAPTEAYSDYFWDYASESEEKFIAFSRELARGARLRSALGRCIEASGWSKGPVRVMLDTLKTVVVPGEIFDAEYTGDYLRANNISHGEHEDVATSHLLFDYPNPVAIMVCDRAALDIVREMFDGQANITSPFESAASYGYRKIKYKKQVFRKEFTTLYLTEKNVYITVQLIPGGKLRYCEALPYSATTDILYYMQELAARFDIRKTPLYIKGVGAEKMEKVLRKMFKK